MLTTVCLFSSRVGFWVRIRFSVGLVIGYAHVFILLSVVIVTLLLPLLLGRRRQCVMGKREVADSQWVVASAASTRRAANAAGSSSSSQTAAVDSTQLMMRPPSTTMATATSSSSTTHAAAVTGAPATASRKTGRLMSLRRMIQDVQQQRLSSSARQRMQQRRSAPVGDVTSSSSVAVEAATVASAAPRVTAMGSDSAAGAGWSTPQRTTSAEAIDVSGSGAVTVSVADDLLEPATVNGEFSTTMSTALLDCALCAVPQPRCNFARVTSSCGHRACVECLRRYLTIEIMESRVNVECPACPERLHPNDVRRLLGNDSTDLVSKYEEFALRRLLVHDPDARWCPAPDCGSVSLTHPFLDTLSHYMLFLMTLKYHKILQNSQCWTNS